jgi:enhancer of polycomb-like protein
VRYTRLSHEKLRDSLEYVVDTEDETWLRSNSKFGGASIVVEEEIISVIATSTVDDSKQQLTSTAMDEDTCISTSEAAEDLSKGSTKRKVTTKISPKTCILTISMLEIMLDIMEKATAFEAIITLDQAELLILKKLPQFYHMYPVRAKAGIVTIRHVINDSYQYWISKRSKLKRPLLRRFWPVTSTEDSNPHLVFRPREKEKYKLRKKRQNDMDAYRKLQQLKQDFSQIRILLGLIRKREELNRSLVLLHKEWFEQKLYDAIDTSGLCRLSHDLDRRSLQKLSEVETHFDVHEGMGASAQWKRKKSRRSSQQQQIGTASKTGSRNTSPVPPSSLSSGETIGLGDNITSATKHDHNYPGGTGVGADVDASLEATKRKLPKFIAGQNNGEPAPSFLQPLITREAYATTWEGSVPHVYTIVDGRAMNTLRFRHRPRVGRGGRLCIDRVPLPTDPNVEPNTYFRAGSRPSVSLEPKERLLDLLPPPIDKSKLSRRIEDICLKALKEDYDTNMIGTSNTTVATASTAAEDPGDNDGVEVIVKMKDWLNTDDQLWGEERYAIGPI